MSKYEFEKLSEEQVAATVVACAVAPKGLQDKFTARVKETPKESSSEWAARPITRVASVPLVSGEMVPGSALQRGPDFASIGEALIWSALLTLVASHRLHNLVRARQPRELRPWYLLIRLGKAFRRTAREIFALLLSHLGLGARVDRRRLTRSVSVQLARVALVPHVAGHRPWDERPT